MKTMAFFFIPLFIGIGKALKLSPPFPLLHTVRAAFTAYGVPTSPIQLIIDTSDITINSFIHLLPLLSDDQPTSSDNLV